MINTDEIVSGMEALKSKGDKMFKNILPKNSDAPHQNLGGSIINAEDDEDNLQTRLLQKTEPGTEAEGEEDFKLTPLDEEEILIAQERIKGMHPLRDEPLHVILPYICCCLRMWRRQKTAHRASSIW